MKRKIIFLSLIFSLVLFSRNVFAYYIDFNSFIKINEQDPVTISNGGYTAKIEENLNYSLVGLLREDYTIPQTGAKIYYLLTVPPNNENYFDIYIYNLTSPITESNPIGGYNDSNQPLYFDGSINLSSYYEEGKTGLIFALSSGWNDGYYDEEGNFHAYTDSTLIISNYPIPEPSTIILLSSGLLAILFLRKRIKKINL